MPVILYRIFIFLYNLGIHLVALFNNKARFWIKGRKKIFKKLRKAFLNNQAPVIWFHCASLGEFEQGRPLLEAFKKKYSDHKILLTFFSPSGYKVHKNYAQADFVFYLPMDGKIHANRFLDITKPDLIIFVKYEFWYFYLTEIYSRKIPILLVSAIFRKNQPFFRWYGTLHRKMLSCFNQIFIQDTGSQLLLAKIGINNTHICGDTRVDRVIAIKENWTAVNSVQEFCQGHLVIVAGSTWDEDDEELNHYVNKHTELRFLIAPHEIDSQRLEDCLRLYKHSVLISELAIHNAEKKFINTLIIDNIGTLSRLYKYGHINFVGGGFGTDGVHNVLEPAVYGKPIIFGPVFEKYLEAVELEESGAAFSVENVLDLEQQFDQLLNDTVLYQHSSEMAQKYIQQKSGATLQILTYIQELILP